MLKGLMHHSSCGSTLWQPLQLDKQDKPSRMQETVGFCQKCGKVLGMKLLSPGGIRSGQGYMESWKKVRYCIACTGEGSIN